MKKTGKIFVSLVVLIAMLFSLNMQIVDAKSHEQNVESKLTKKLIKMGFSQEEIENMSNQTKSGLIKSGGKKADYSVNLKRYYNSLDGNKYEITDKNEQEINEIKEQDLRQYSAETGISMMKMDSFSTLANEGYDELVDGILSLGTYVAKTTSSSTSEYEYIIFLDWSWNGQPVAIFNDNAAISWDNRFIGLSSTVEKYFFGEWGSDPSRIKTTPEVYGLKASFPVYGNSSYQMGGISQHVRIPKSFQGQTGRIVAAYVHSLSPMNFGVDIGPASISIPGGVLAEEFHLDMNITIGNSYF